MNRSFRENANANAAIDALLSDFSRKPAEDRALILLRHFLDAAQRTSAEGNAGFDRLTANFHAWFDDPRNRPAKERAMDRLIGALDAKLAEFEKPE